MSINVCVSDGKCIVAKRLIGPGCRLGGEWGRSRMGVLDGVLSSKGKESFGGKCGAFHCIQWGRRRALPKLLRLGLVWMSYNK